MKQPKTFKELFKGTNIKPEIDEKGNINYHFKAVKKTKEETMSPEDFIISEETDWHKSPMIMASSFPREITYELMEKYAAYRLMLKEQQTMKQFKQIEAYL